MIRGRSRQRQAGRKGWTRMLAALLASVALAVPAALATAQSDPSASDAAAACEDPAAFAQAAAEGGPLGADAAPCLLTLEETFPEGTELQELAPTGSPGGEVSQAAWSGHQCYGRSDDPHPSTKQPGYIHARAWTDCYVAGWDPHVEAWLWKGDKVVDHKCCGEVTSPGFVREITKDNCPQTTRQFTLWGYHWATAHTPGFTENSKWINC